MPTYIAWAIHMIPIYSYMQGHILWPANFSAPILSSVPLLHYSPPFSIAPRILEIEIKIKVMWTKMVGDSDKSGW
jgi:hypothetical protein